MSSSSSRWTLDSSWWCCDVTRPKNGTSYMHKISRTKIETLHMTEKSAVTDVVLEKNITFGNPSKYVPRVTGLNFLDQASRSAILIPRWLTIAVALWKRTRIMVFIGKWTFPCSVANSSAFQKAVSPSVRCTSWVLHQGLIRRGHIHSHCRSNWGKGPLPFL